MVNIRTDLEKSLEIRTSVIPNLAFLINTIQRPQCVFKRGSRKCILIVN